MKTPPISFKHWLGSLCIALLGLLSIDTAHGQIFVTDWGNNAIAEYSTAGSMLNSSLITGLNQPRGIVSSGTDLFFLTGTTIAEYTTAGVVVGAPLIPRLSGMADLALSGSDLFIGTGSKVVEYTTSGTLVSGTVASGYSSLGNIAISGSYLFILTNSGISEYTTSGDVVNPSLVSVSNGECIAASGSQLFVTTWLSAGAINEYTLGAVAGTIASTTLSLVSGLYYPEGITVSGEDLYVVTSGSNNIGEYTTSGATVNAALVTGNHNFSYVTVVQPVPEPSTWAMLAAGFGVLLLYRRRTAKCSSR